MLRILSVALLWLPAAVLAASTGRIEHANNDLANTASLQRGAKYFVNYCLGCHSLKYVRYSRLAEDLELSEQQLLENLMFAAERPHETVEIAMRPEAASRWLGAAPPDLSLVARSRTADWVYSYMKGFYVDESRPLGVNNLLLDGVSMPHVLWDLQGLQRAVFSTREDGRGVVHREFSHFEPLTQGSLSAAEYDLFVRDLVNFLDYVGEPMQLERRSLGIKVLAFLGLFFILALMLKSEIWKGVR